MKKLPLDDIKGMAVVYAVKNPAYLHQTNFYRTNSESDCHAAFVHLNGLVIFVRAEGLQENFPLAVPCDNRICNASLGGF